MAPPFPFSALVGQEEMKRALLIASIEPTIGGVLIFGDRGTGKSTAVRALAGLLPPVEVVEGCPYGCAPNKLGGICQKCSPTPKSKKAKIKSVQAPVPMVDLPLGVTEDRVVGALDLELALSKGQKSFHPGLLARAHRGFLYIDEVNLLEDHIVDLLLDVAASGENVVERDGLSVRHPARFVLIGSGNPEEGELRPQLLDRFGLSVEVSTPQDITQRIEVVRRRDAYERDPAAFVASWAAEEASVAAQVEQAKSLLDQVEVPDDTLVLAAKLCQALGADGLRGELTLMRAARAVAALAGETRADADALRAVAPATLRHRLRRNPLDEGGSGLRVERALEEVLGPDSAAA
ncbi:MAG: magnesium chelatase ATPase subunit I [Pseudomonadota bacterium]